jgi:hypothetical protein
MLDPIHIKIVEQNLINKNEIQNNNLTLNIKTGFVTNEQNANIVKPFVSVLAVPLDYNESDTSITPVMTDFDGFKRSTIHVFHSNENSTSEIEYDLETGILLNVHTASIIKINDKYEVVNFSNKLTSTSMIYSNSVGFQNIKNMISIPDWVKSTSKWWSEDKIPNSEFVKMIQYMMSNGMMPVQFDSSLPVPLQPIPMWIKNNVRWWADGQISDDEFVKGIQWLINNGIIII